MAKRVKKVANMQMVECVLDDSLNCKNNGQLIWTLFGKYVLLTKVETNPNKSVIERIVVKC